MHHRLCRTVISTGKDQRFRQACCKIILNYAADKSAILVPYTLIANNQHQTEIVKVYSPSLARNPIHEYIDAGIRDLYELRRRSSRLQSPYRAGPLFWDSVSGASESVRGEQAHTIIQLYGALILAQSWLVCVCVCVCARARARVRVFVCVCVRARACPCVLCVYGRGVPAVTPAAGRLGPGIQAERPHPCAVCALPHPHRSESAAGGGGHVSVSVARSCRRPESAGTPQGQVS